MGITLRADVHHYDAVALSDGRIAVAVATYSRTLDVLMVDDTSVSSSIELARGDSAGVSMTRVWRGEDEHVLVVSVDRDRGHVFEATADLEVVLDEDVPLPD